MSKKYIGYVRRNYKGNSDVLLDLKKNQYVLIISEQNVNFWTGRIIDSKTYEFISEQGIFPKQAIRITNQFKNDEELEDFLQDQREKFEEEIEIKEKIRLENEVIVTGPKEWKPDLEDEEIIVESIKTSKKKKKEKSFFDELGIDEEDWKSDSEEEIEENKKEEEFEMKGILSPTKKREEKKELEPEIRFINNNEVDSSDDEMDDFDLDLNGDVASSESEDEEIEDEEDEVIANILKGEYDFGDKDDNQSSYLQSKSKEFKLRKQSGKDLTMGRKKTSSIHFDYEKLKEKYAKLEEELTVFQQLKKEFGENFNFSSITMVKRTTSILQAKCKKLTTEKTGFAKRIDNLKKQNLKLSERLSAQKRQIINEPGTHDSSLIKEKEKQIFHQNQLVKRLKEKIDELENEKETLSQQNNITLPKKEEFSKDKYVNKEELDEKNEEIALKKKLIEAKEQEIQNLKNASENQNKELKRILELQRTAKKEFEKEISSLKEEHEKEKERLESHNNRLKEVFESEKESSLKSKQTKFESERLIFIEKENELKKQIQELQRKHNNISEESTNHKKLVDEKTKEIGKLKEQLLVFINKFKDVNSKEKEREKQNEKQKEEIKKLNLKISAASNERADMKEKYEEQLAAQKQNLKDQKNQMKEEIKEIQKEKANSLLVFKKQLGSMKKKLTEINIATIKKKINEDLMANEKIMNKLSKDGIQVIFKAYLDTTMKYKKECKTRKRIFNTLQNLRGKIRVFVRVRPIIKVNETKFQIPVSNDSLTIKIKNLKGTGTLDNGKGKKIQSSSYSFDKVFGSRTKQSDIFAEVKDLAICVLDGYNSTIFAYGQTGSGKTFTMEGPSLKEENRGINFRTVIQLFQQIEKRKDAYNYKVEASVAEIYNNELFDLLAPGGKKKKCKILMSGKQVETNLTREKVTCLKDILKVLQKGKKIRSTASTNSNLHSSRSHCIVSIYCEGKNFLSGVKTRSRLHLIDLAGSEKLKKSCTSDTHPDRIKEAVNINKSLSALGKVMQSISKNEKHIPFRDSELTSYLKDSLSGNSKVLMIACVQSIFESYDETLNTLKFASGINKIVLGAAKKNVTK